MVKKEIAFLLIAGLLFSGLFLSINSRQTLLNNEQKKIDIYSIIKNNTTNLDKFNRENIQNKNTLIICWSSIYANNTLLFEYLNSNKEKYDNYYILAISPYEDEDTMPQSKLNIEFIFNEPLLISELKKIPSNKTTLEIPFFIEFKKGEIINTISF